MGGHGNNNQARRSNEVNGTSRLSQRKKKGDYDANRVSSIHHPFGLLIANPLLQSDGALRPRTHIQRIAAIQFKVEAYTCMPASYVVVVADSMFNRQYSNKRTHMCQRPSKTVLYTEDDAKISVSDAARTANTR